ncbi:hypothetical protein Hypma_014506 [Hypsizygus marmoreus]|uniref:Uncharacterized protein n=1 Tax=Hypsizygus marmoreus TaxID=39966 RepID=A0A369JJ49_HYPMA|nr:hypothetical protein Hypma_014506 [Hypsizygus marmoreus]
MINERRPLLCFSSLIRCPPPFHDSSPPPKRRSTTAASQNSTQPIPPPTNDFNVPLYPSPANYDPHRNPNQAHDRARRSLNSHTTTALSRIRGVSNEFTRVLQYGRDTHTSHTTTAFFGDKTCLKRVYWSATVSRTRTTSSGARHTY